MLADFFRNTEAGQVMTVICEDVSALFTKIGLQFEELQDSERAVTRCWECLPTVPDIISDTIHGLARVSRAAWPDWFSIQNCFTGKEEKISLDGPLTNQLTVDKLVQTTGGISASWLRSAVEACENGKSPLVRGVPNSIQIKQLALTIAPDRLVIVLGVNEKDPSDERLLGFAKAAEWIARESGCRVVAIIHHSLQKSRALDSIRYRSISLVTEVVMPGSEDDEPDKALFGPVCGKPHPFSPGEQKLAEKLLVDPELSSCFQFNQRIRSERESTYIVDLLWLEGKVIVEVDGYSFHSSPQAFKMDRNRDYELIISGYIVLRLPHEEIMTDVDLALEKIRDVVHYRKNQMDQPGKIWISNR